MKDYGRFGMGEYWRFDPSGGEYHDAALAGDRLVDGRSEPIEIEDLGEGRLRGYSEALGLYVCQKEGMLRFFDPVSESYLRSHEEDVGRAETAEYRAGATEARVAELEGGIEASVRRIRAQSPRLILSETECKEMRYFDTYGKRTSICFLLSR